MNGYPDYELYNNAIIAKLYLTTANKKLTNYKNNILYLFPKRYDAILDINDPRIPIFNSEITQLIKNHSIINYWRPAAKPGEWTFNYILGALSTWKYMSVENISQLAVVSTTFTKVSTLEILRNNLTVKDNAKRYEYFYDKKDNAVYFLIKELEFIEFFKKEINFQKKITPHVIFNESNEYLVIEKRIPSNFSLTSTDNSIGFKNKPVITLTEEDVTTNTISNISITKSTNENYGLTSENNSLFTAYERQLSYITNDNIVISDNDRQIIENILSRYPGLKLISISK